MQWELGKETNFEESDKEKGTYEKLLFHVALPRATGREAEKVVKKRTLSSRTSGRTPCQT